MTATAVYRQLWRRPLLQIPPLEQAATAATLQASGRRHFPLLPTPPHDFPQPRGYVIGPSRANRGSPFFSRCNKHLDALSRRRTVGSPSGKSTHARALSAISGSERRTSGDGRSPCQKAVSAGLPIVGSDTADQRSLTPAGRGVRRRPGIVDVATAPRKQQLLAASQDKTAEDCLARSGPLHPPRGVTSTATRKERGRIQTAPQAFRHSAGSFRHSAGSSSRCGSPPFRPACAG